MPHNIELLFYNSANSSRQEEQNRNDLINKKNSSRHKKKRPKKSYHFGDTSEEPSNIINIQNKSKNICSAPDFRKHLKRIKVKTSSSLTTQKTKAYYSKYVVNHVNEYRVPGNTNPFGRVRQPIKWRVYRCQFGAQEESCCCSCNSDAMFEVMKSLYDCYKKKNCDHCNCILCGHLPREERKAGEERKSVAAIGAETTSMKERRDKMKKIAALLEGKSPAEKEKVLRQMAMDGIPLPEGATPSEKELIKKVRNDLGLPPEPASPEERAKLRRSELTGMVVPLEGKSQAEKEKILRKQAALGLPFPVGRTPSEKALIDKIRSEMPSKVVGIPSEKLRKAKAAGFLTPLEGKTPEQKENILRGLAKMGIPLPEGTTPSENKLIDKVRKELGLPPKPKNQAMRDKYTKALADGIITPLEGKTPAQKEKILKGMAQAGLPLPEGRTPSEKALIKKVKAETGYKTPAGAGSTGFPAGVPSEKLRKAKAEGLITPLTGKTPEQKEKILKGLAKMGIPLPEAKTPSDKKIIDKIRKELGLPPEPKSPSMRDKYNKAQAQGILTPLEGKTPAQKEKILRGMAQAGIPLPEGRTPSEKALINKIKAEPGYKREGPSEFPAGIPSEKLRKAKAEGLITPLTGKTPAQKETILKGLAKMGIPLPEGTTTSEKKLIDKVRKELGLPPEPKTQAMRDKYNKALVDGIITPLEGKNPAQKEKILKGMAQAGLPLPEGRTPSEKALINKVKAETGYKTPTGEGWSGFPAGVPAEKLRKAKAEGLITPLTGKTPAQKEKILKGLAKMGIPLPESTTTSEKKLIDKVRKELGLPPEPKTQAMRDKYNKALAGGIITPLEGKTPAQKEKILKGMTQAGLPLPEGRTPSEKALIKKVKVETGYKTPAGEGPSEFPAGIPSEKLRKAKAAGFLTPLAGKTPEKKEKILRGLAQHGIPLPEGKTPSEKKIIDKVRKELGLPPEPQSQAMKDKYNKALADGIITPLEGKTPAQKENILKGMAEAGISLPEGRTPSEKALIKKVKAETGYKTPVAIPSGFPAGIPSEKLRKAKAEGLMTPLTGKTPEQKEKIMKGLAKLGIPLPEGRTPSERKLIDKVRKELGLPPEPKSREMRDKYNKALADGIVTPLEGKTPAQKEKILKGMVQAGLPLPEGRTPSEKALISKVKAETGYKTPLMKPSEFPAGIPSEKLRKAKAAGFLTPLTGKTPAQKEKILKSLAAQGIPLPEPRTSSEKALIDRIKAEVKARPSVTPSKRRPLSEEARKLDEETAKVMKEGKGPSDECICGILTPESEKLSARLGLRKSKQAGVPAGIASEKLRKAKAAGLLTPLAGKTSEQKENILRGLAQHGIPLPEGKTPSEKKLLNKIRKELGLPPEPKSQAIKDKYNKAQAQGIITPLQGKTPAQKEKILRGMAQAGIPLPEGRTPSEKALINKIKAEPGYKTPAEGPPGFPAGIPSEKLRKAKAAGFLTPLAGKTPEQKEKILRGLAQHGILLPEDKTTSEKKIIDKVRKELGLPPEPQSQEMRDKYNKALADGIITPLEGKTPAQKEKILKGMAQAGLPLPEGRTGSEKSLIKKVKAEAGYKTPAVVPFGLPAGIPSEKLRKAKAAGFLTPLAGKTPDQKEKILRGLAQHGIPLPEVKTPSEKKMIDKVRKELGLPPEPKSQVMKDKYNKAQADGIITPLEGKTPAQKEKILKGMAQAGLPLPKGRTPSEKALIKKVKAETGYKTPGTVPSRFPAGIPSEKLRRAKAEGLITPLSSKTPEQKENILKGLAKLGIPLPEGKSPSEKKFIDKVRKELGLPPELKSQAMRDKYNTALADGIITPLEGKTPAQKEKILKGMAQVGLPLPEGRTPSEKALIKKVKAETGHKTPEDLRKPSEKLRKAKAAGLLTTLEGKTPEQKENILRGLAMQGLPFPLAKTESDKKLTAKVRADLGMPPEPKNAAEKEKYDKAMTDGLLLPLEGKTPEEKEKILRDLLDRGIELPIGRTTSEKALIAKVKAGGPPRIPSEKLKKAKAAGLLTPLKGKTPAQREKILKGLAELGLPLPEGKTPSEKSLIQKIKAEYGVPPEAITPSEKAIIAKARADGLLTPLAGKTPEQKEKILKGLAEAGLPLPEGRTQSEKTLIKKVRGAAGLPPERTPSERAGKIKKKDKGIGAGRSAARAAMAAAGIDQKYEDIQKTTKCDRACGCDKKKIRFKHSYVKIRVTSPDISSLCPCPEECIPGVKGGVFVDNEGIKVTVGSAIGVPSLSFKNIDDYSDKEVNLENVKHVPYEHSDLTAKNNSQTSSNSTYGEQNYTDGDTYASEIEIDSSTGYNRFLLKNYLQDKSYDYIMHHFSSHYEISKNYSISRHMLKNVQSAIPASFSTLSFEESFTKVNSKTTLNSIVMLRTESCLGFSSSLTASIETISIISLHNSSIIPTSSHYICYPESMSASSLDEDNSGFLNNEVDYIATDVRTSESDEITNITTDASDKSHKPKGDGTSKIYNKNIFTYKVSQKNIDKDENSYKPYGNNHKPIIIINELDRSSCDVMKIVEEVMSQQNIFKTSSIFVVVPTSDEDNDGSDSASSTICICLSKNFFNSNKKLNEKTVQYQRPKPSGGIKFTAKGRVNLNSATSATAFPSYSKNYSFNNLKVTETFATEQILNRSKHNKKCQVNEEIVTNGKYNSFSMDTSQDRPCCCGQPRPLDTHVSHHPRSVVLSDFIAPMIASQGLDQEVYQTRRDLNLKCQTSYLFPNNCTSYSTCDVYPCKKNTETENICGDTEPQNQRNEQRKEKVPMKFEIKGRLAKQTEATGECPPCECVKVSNTNGGCKPSDCKYPDCNENGADNNKRVGITPIIHVGPSNASCSTCTNRKEKKVTMKVDCPCDNDDELHNRGNKTLLSSPSAPPPKLPSTTNPPTFKSIGCQCCMCDIPSQESLKAQIGNIGFTGKHVGAQSAGQPMEKQTARQTRGPQTATLKKSTASIKKSTCQCDTVHKLRNRLWRKSKNIECECRHPKYKDCECPPAEEDETVKEKEDGKEKVEEEEIDYSQYAGQLYISEKEYLRRVRQEETELTERTSSGFRIVFQKRSIGSSEMSFEDALKYFEEHPEDIPPPIERNEIESNEAEDCKCGPFVTYPEDTEEAARSGKGPTGDTGVVCECPSFEGEEEEKTEEDGGGGAGGGKYLNKDKSGDENLKGLKLRIGGKGTGSKGLAGICCFDMLQESNHLISHSIATASH